MARAIQVRLREAYRVPVYLVVSGMLHAVVLGAADRLAYRPAQADLSRYTRVRLVRPGAIPDPVRNRLAVSLPGARVQPLPPAGPGAPLPSTAELQRQWERIQALRAEFFRPMNVVNLPMPVLPAPPSGSAPPLWGVPLDRIPALPSTVQPFPTSHGPPAMRPGASAMAGAPQPGGVGTPRTLAQQAAADLLRQPPVAPGPASPPPHPEGAEQGTRGAEDTGQPSPTPAPPDTGGRPADGNQQHAEVARRDTPATQDEGATPSSSAPQSSASGKPGDASTPPPQSAEAPTKGTAAAPDSGSAPGARPASQEPGSVPNRPSSAEDATGAAPQPPKPAIVPIPTGGPQGRLAGTYRIPLGASLTGFRSSACFVFLAREMNARTRVKIVPAPYVPVTRLTRNIPLLYLKGQGQVILSDAERDALGNYVRRGGTLFIDGLEGEFGESMLVELEYVFGRAPTTLPATHPIYNAFYRLGAATGVKLFPLQVIAVNGRPAVIVSPAFLGIRWQTREDPDHRSALAHGVNIVLYVLSRRK